MRSTCSIHGNNPGFLNAGLQGGFGFSSFLWLAFPLKSMPGHVGNAFGLIFFFLSGERKFRGFFRGKKNPDLDLIIELRSTHYTYT